MLGKQFILSYIPNPPTTQFLKTDKIIDNDFTFTNNKGTQVAEKHYLRKVVIFFTSHQRMRQYNKILTYAQKDESNLKE